MPLVLVEGLLERLGGRVHLGGVGVSLASDGFPLGWAEVDDVLPNHQMPRGIVEIRSPNALGGGTSMALAAVRAIHGRDERAWCAWLDPEGTLYSPGVAMAGVDLNRLAVVRPPRRDLARIAIKVARSQAFDVIVIDVDFTPGAVAGDSLASSRRSGTRIEVWVRKLALLAAEGGATVILLTDARVLRTAPLPVALRLELTRKETTLDVRVGKERFGRVGLAKAVPIRTRPGRELTG